MKKQRKPLSIVEACDRTGPLARPLQNLVFCAIVFAEELFDDSPNPVSAKKVADLFTAAKELGRTIRKLREALS